MTDTQAVTNNLIPVFPLGTVLFPDGVLPLRIFEARYMDMVRDCLKHDGVFGVCLLTDGTESGEPASHEPIGCSARIDQWDMEQLGLLNIRTIGLQRFEIVHDEVKPDGLKVANVEFLEPEPDSEVPPEFSPCVSLLQRVVNDLVSKETDPMRKMIQDPCHFESSSWVSNRLCEFLPIAAQTKQKLMVLDDPLARLSIIHEYLSKQQVI